MAEGQAKVGHDIMGLRTWYVNAHADKFVPVDDDVDPLLQKYGKIATAAEYCAKIDGRWLAVPTCYGSTAAATCARRRFFMRIPNDGGVINCAGPDASRD